MNRQLLLGLFTIACANDALAQSLFLKDERPVIGADGQPDPYAGLRGVSLTFLEPPKIRTFAVHDQVVIIVDESSQQSSNQKLDTKKDYKNDLALAAFVDMQQLPDFTLTGRDNENAALLGLKGKSDYKSNGTYNRSDRFQAKIAAEIIDIKPNGIMVLEARKIKTTDEETQTMVLTGRCRQEDVTSSNTVLSSQLAELTLSNTNTGQVKDAATKGWVPRLLEAIFGL